MTYTKTLSSVLLIAALAMVGCSSNSSTTDDGPPAQPAQAENDSGEEAVHGHGVGPNGGVVFDLGAYHAEFTVDHGKQQCMVIVLGADEKSLTEVAAQDLTLTIKETKTADGTPVASMTIELLPQDEADGKASTFLGTDPGLANVADFDGTVLGMIDGKPSQGEFSESAGGHAHGHSPHDGMVARLMDKTGSAAGFVELKLHDDKGDLELWLAKDQLITQPIDVPSNSEIQVSFLDVDGKTVVLRVRNADQNEDEDGTPNMRNGKTNYFIFPGDTGQDASWLMGAEFKSAVQVTFSVDGKSYTSEEFVLVPHTHGHGHSH